MMKSACIVIHSPDANVRFVPSGYCTNIVSCKIGTGCDDGHDRLRLCVMCDWSLDVKRFPSQQSGNVMRSCGLRGTTPFDEFVPASLPSWNQKCNGFCISVAIAFPAIICNPNGIG